MRVLQELPGKNTPRANRLVVPASFHCTEGLVAPLHPIPRRRLHHEVVLLQKLLASCVVSPVPGHDIPDPIVHRSNDRLSHTGREQATNQQTTMFLHALARNIDVTRRMWMADAMFLLNMSISSSTTCHRVQYCLCRNPLVPIH
jgi:hypothetical protein